MIDNRYRAADITDAVIKEFLLKHINNELPRLRRLFDAYDGARKVNKGEVVEGRPDNQVKAEWPAYIADMVTNYTIGIPVKYSYNDDAGRPTGDAESIEDVLAANNEDIVNFELVDDLCIFGKAYAMDFMDEAGNFQFTRCCPLNAFVIYDKKVKPQPIGAIYYEYDAEEGKASGTFYDTKEAKEFTFGANNGALSWTGSLEQHKINGVPITEIYANKYATASFEKVLPLSDGYNVTLSNNTDDLQGIANAILHIKGAGALTREDIESINRDRVTGFDGEMGYVTKNLDASVLETHKNSLRTDMLSIAKTPNLTDEQFAGNLSGVAIRFKLWGIDQVRQTIIRYFTPLLYLRLKRILEAKSAKTVSLAAVTRFVDISFTPNMPTNDMETVQMATMLYDRISPESFLNMLPDWIVADVDAELQRLRDMYSETPPVDDKAPPGEDVNVDEEQ